MAYEFRLPDIGEGLTEAEVLHWLVPVGQPVKVDQPVVEVETDKAVVEIPSPKAGVVLHHGGKEGETLQVGTILVVIGEAGEAWPPEDAEPPAKPIVGSLTEEATAAPARTERKGTAAVRPLALPVVRKLAKEMGIDLDTIAGSGPSGRITREDVLAAADGGKEAPKPAPTEEVKTPAATPARAKPAASPGERRTMSKLRRTIASNMARSWAEIPHVTTFDQVDASRLLAARRALSTRYQTSLPLDALLVKAVIPALQAFPDFNSSLDGDDLVIRPTFDVGVAVDTPEGLVVVVVPDAGAKSLLELGNEIMQLAEGAKARKLKAEQLSGQSFTVSNIGALGGGFGTPIVPYGTTAILSAGRAAEAPVARDGRVKVAPVMPLSLSYDHRVIDGGQGRRFMAMLLENLEEPALFLAS
ncbi:MAG TPA: dihydrolipoamide acetyltransferase family protein [Acidimicrobiia bacterium]